MRTELTIEKIRYCVSDHPAGGRYISRIAPYDETDYHWALSNQAGNKWTIYRHSPGREVCVTSADAPADIAQKCLALDRHAGLKRRGGIW